MSKTMSPDTALAIANERENFRNLFRQTPELVCILSGPDHVFDFVNDAHIAILGFDATGKTVREAQPESIEIHGILDNVYRSGQSAYLHEIPVTVTDRLRYFNLTYAPSRLEGNINGLMIMGLEVTDQVLTRETLKSQNRALEMTFSGAPLKEVLASIALAVETHIGRGTISSILLVDESGKFLKNGAAPSLPAEYNAAIDGLAIAPNTGSCGTAAYVRHEVVVNDIATDSLWEGFHNVAKKYGLKSCWSMPILSSRGDLIGTFALYNRPPHDPFSYEQQIVNLLLHTAAMVIERHLENTARLKAKSALVDSENRYRTSEEQLGLAINVAKVGFYDWDILKNEMTFSKQMVADWGVKEAKISLEGAMLLVHEDDRRRIQEMVTAALEKNVPYHTEYRVVRPDGEIRWVDVRGQVHRDPDGKPVRFFGTCVSIDEQKEKESILRQAQSVAEEANLAKGIFLANMSHEIRTPLGAIMGFLDLIKNPDNTQEQLKHFIGVIDRNSRQLLRIVDDVLDLSKIEAGKFLIEKISFSLIELLTDFTALMSFKAKEKGLIYQLHLESNIPDLVVGDPTRLRQILSNIVGNAIKFTEYGHVLVRVGFDNGIFKMSVEDSGCGISVGTAERLFQPFSQADNSTTRIYGGTGLGLTLTRRLSQALGGGFNLQKSAVGRGSTFVSTIRLGTLAATKMMKAEELKFVSKGAEFKSPDKGLLEGVKVLIVDDSVDNQELMQFFLERLGATTEVVDNGEDGVNRALNSDFDVLLMDIQMPVMDGHEATRRLRAAGFKKPIIALTAHAMKEERQRCEQSGFTAFLSKPIDKEVLLGKLTELR
jgi:PAS domain S-box-containing protein